MGKDAQDPLINWPEFDLEEEKPRIAPEDRRPLADLLADIRRSISTLREDTDALEELVTAVEGVLREGGGPRE